MRAGQSGAGMLQPFFWRKGRAVAPLDFDLEAIARRADLGEAEVGRGRSPEPRMFVTRPYGAWRVFHSRPCPQPRFLFNSFAGFVGGYSA